MIGVSIKGSSRLVIRGLNAVPSRIDQAAALGLTRGLLYAAGVARRQYLSGPRPAKLDVRTTRLRDSIATEVTIDKMVVGLERVGGAIQERPVGSGEITGRIGSNISYAAFHEFGFHGVINVSAHQRVISTLDAAGNKIDQRRPIRDRHGNFIGYKESHGRAASRSDSRAAFVFTQNVRAHQRHIDYAGRPYIRPALEESLPVITREINKELKALSPGTPGTPPSGGSPTANG